MVEPRIEPRIEPGIEPRIERGDGTTDGRSEHSAGWTPERPHMPGYGIAEGAEGLLPYTWADTRLVDARRYWVATVTPGGAAHLAPVWAVWVAGALWFSSGAASRKAVNLGHRPTVAVATDDAAAAVVLEGTAALVDAVPDGVVQAYRAKYGTDLVELAEPVYRVMPAKLLGLREEDFTTSATRWRVVAEASGRG